MADDVLIKLENVSKSFFAQQRETKILRDVNISIKRNAFTIIYGPSGSGKSTLLNTIFGLEKPTSGRVLIGGLDIYGLNQQDRAYFRSQYMGMVAQSNYWIHSLNVLENVAMPLYLSGVEYKPALTKAKKYLEQINMAHFAGEMPGSLSGGEQQRISMARALAGDPLIILADEPTGNLDTGNGDMIMNLLANYRHSQGKTVVLATHNLQYLVLSDEQIYVKDGVVTQTSGDYKTPADVLSRMWQQIDDGKGKNNARKTVL